MPRRLRAYLEFAQQFEQIESRLLVSTSEQVRKDLGDLSELCASIKIHGLLQPILVRPKGDHFEVVCGNRRLAATRKLMRRQVDCIVKDLTDREAFEVSLVENVQRRTLNPMEEAEAYKRYVSEFGWGGVSDLATRIGKSQVYVSHRLALLNLPEDLKKMMEDGTIAPSLGQELAWVKSIPQRDLLMSLAGTEKLTVRRIRGLRRVLESSEVQSQRGSLLDGSFDFAPAGSGGGHMDHRHVGEAILALRIAQVKMGDAITQLKANEVRLRMMEERVWLNEMIDRLLRIESGLRPG